MKKAITDGLAFIEFVCSAEDNLKSLFEKFGFSAVTRSARTGAVLMQQGEARFVINQAANEFRNIHGSSVRAIGIKVDDAELALAQAISGGAGLAVEAKTGAFIVKAPAIMGIGGSLVYFVESNWEAEFSNALEAPEVSRIVDAAIVAVDHTSNIVHPKNLDLWADFYKDTFGFRQKQYLDVKGKMTGMRARSMVSPCGKVSIPIAAAAHDQPGVLNQNDEFIRDYRGEGIQHIALLSSDLSRTVDALSSMGIEFMDAPHDSYYGNLNARVPGHGQDLEALKRRGILLDGQPDGKILLQRFTRRQIGPVFFEIIERRGEDGFGEGNFKALFESQESDQVKRGALVMQCSLET
ncbi:MAG: 4-hydroxyphenylpyruvate dioxygenase [Pseudomonadota bacterium]